MEHDMSAYFAASLVKEKIPVQGFEGCSALGSACIKGVLLQSLLTVC
jgi:hypothetical protein